MEQEKGDSSFLEIYSNLLLENSLSVNFIERLRDKRDKSCDLENNVARFYGRPKAAKSAAV